MTSTEMSVRAYAVRDEMNFARQILLDPDLSGAAKQVAGAILSFINWKTGTAWPSLETIASRASVSVASVKRALAQLSRYIEIAAGGGRGRANVYRLRIGAKIQVNHEPEYRQTSSYERPKTGSPMSPQPGVTILEPTPIPESSIPTPSQTAQTELNEQERGGGQNRDFDSGMGDDLNRLASLVSRTWKMSRDRVTCMLIPLVEHHGPDRIYRAIGQLMTSRVTRDDLPTRLGAAVGATGSQQRVNPTPVPLVTSTRTAEENAVAAQHRKVLTALSELPFEKKSLIRETVFDKLLEKYPTFDPALLANDIVLSNRIVEFGIEIM
jgi:hypothetical protein